MTKKEKEQLVLATFLLHSVRMTLTYFLGAALAGASVFCARHFDPSDKAAIGMITCFALMAGVPCVVMCVSETMNVLKALWFPAVVVWAQSQGRLEDDNPAPVTGQAAPIEE